MLKGMGVIDPASAHDEIKRKQEYRFVIAFGFGFISLMFLGFATGYFIGSVVMEWDQQSSLICSIVTGTISLIVEAILLLIKMEKMQDGEK